jgi:hypothetical protein
MTQQQRLDKWIEQQLSRSMPNTLIENDSKELLAFGRYLIKRADQGFSVYKNLDPRGVFSDRRTALSWCVADKFNRQDLARCIMNLDVKVRSLRDDVIMRDRLGSQSQSHRFQYQVSSKLIHKKQQLKSLEHQLDKYTGQAKYLQIRGFQNETARTRRP